MDDSDSQPPAPGGAGYWFTPVPIYLIDLSFNADSPVNGSAVMLWSHLHRHYAWRKRMFPSYATLAKETGQSESAVKRQLIALREAGALDWSPNYSQRGRSSNDYALAPHRPFEFDRDLAREVEVKNELHRPVEVKSDPGVEVKSDRHPQFKNDPVVEEHRVSKRSLSSQLPQQQAQEPPTAPVERETFSNDGQKIAAAWAAIHGVPNPRAEASIAAEAVELLAAGWTIPDLVALAEHLARNYRRGTQLSKHIPHWQESRCGTHPVAVHKTPIF